MSRLFVKICGITSAEDAQAAADADADAIGFVFWPGSPRLIDAAAARRIGEQLPRSILRVGVFVDAPRAQIARTVEAARLDVVQLHGDEAPADLSGLPRPAWKAVRVDGSFAVERVTPYLRDAAAILLDTAGSVPGGTGQAFDWTAATMVRPHVAYVILAGGLTPENVAEGVRTVHPDGVDVSSGVEKTPGRKDHDKIRAFIERARSA